MVNAEVSARWLSYVNPDELFVHSTSHLTAMKWEAVVAAYLHDPEHWRRRAKVMRSIAECRARGRLSQIG
jgi:hypothetical protein